MPDWSNVLIVLGQSEPLGEEIGMRLQQAIEQDSALGRSSVRSRILRLPELIELESDWSHLANYQVCALTLNLPDWLTFPAQSVYRCCRDVVELQRQVSQWGYGVGEGNLWLPIVLTARGILYGEVIAEPNATLQYVQPVNLPDRWRQPLYSLGLRLLRSLQASPAVYMMRFSLQAEILFDRLLPFPAAPAIASWAVQMPDLFTCHWRCVSGKAIRDLVIPGQVVSGGARSGA